MVTLKSLLSPRDVGQDGRALDEIISVGAGALSFIS